MAKRYLEFDTSTGNLKEVAGLVSSAGAGDAGKIPALDADGKLAENMMSRTFTATTAGAGDAGKAVILDTDGRLNESILPTGIGADVKIIPASEGLSGGDYVNVWNDGGTIKCRKADAATAKEADGFVRDSVLSGADALVYFEGVNDSHTGLTVGARYFLSGATPGGVTATAPSTAGHIAQFIGKALSATEMSFEADTPVIRA
jgi:hypothetical protein